MLGNNIWEQVKIWNNDNREYEFARREEYDGLLLGHLEVKCCENQGVDMEVKQ